MARTKTVIKEKDLTKGELRKLNALRKSIGSDIGEQAFIQWYESKDSGDATIDPNIPVIQDALEKVIDQLRFPRGGGYQIRRGRGRVVVEPLA